MIREIEKDFKNQMNHAKNEMKKLFVTNENENQKENRENKHGVYEVQNTQAAQKTDHGVAENQEKGAAK